MPKIQNIIKPNWDAQTHISPTLRWLTSISSFPFLLYPHRNFSTELTILWIETELTSFFQTDLAYLYSVETDLKGMTPSLANKQIYTKV